MGKLTTHVLDTAHGTPAAGMQLQLWREQDGHWLLVTSLTLNSDGRSGEPLLQGEHLAAGRYRIDFAVADYFRARGTAMTEPAFLDVVPIAFGIADPAGHYHVPLLVSPWSYSTYRGS